jgi:hypothetical protein
MSLIGYNFNHFVKRRIWHQSSMLHVLYNLLQIEIIQFVIAMYLLTISIGMHIVCHFAIQTFN